MSVPVTSITAWKVFKYRVFSGPYFPVFGLNTGKYGPEKTSYSDTFHTMYKMHIIMQYTHFESLNNIHCTKMKFSIKDLFSKCEQIHKKPRIWSYLLKKSLIKNFLMVQWSPHIVTFAICRIKIKLRNVGRAKYNFPSGYKSLKMQNQKANLWRFFCSLCQVLTFLLTHFMPLVSFYTTQKHQKTSGFRKYRKRPLAWIGLTKKPLHELRARR